MRHAVRATVTAATVLVMTVTAATPVPAGPAVVSDQTAWEEISASLRLTRDHFVT